MSEENHKHIGNILDVVRDGLAPYVLTRYKRRHKAEHYLKILKETLQQNSMKRPFNFDSEGEALLEIDAAGWLNAIVLYRAPFTKELGRKVGGKDENAKNGINLVSELLLARNRWAHKKRRDVITDEDVFRVADTANRLLKAVKADEEAAKTEEVKRTFGGKLYIPQEESSETAAEAPQPTPTAEPKVQIVPAPPPRVDLRGANLRGMDLRNRNLRFADLRNAVMDGANFRKEDLSGAVLDRAVLRKADLSNAKLVGAKLSNVDFNNAKLSHTLLHRAKLNDAKFRHATMEFAVLQYADMRNSDMDGANLRNADLAYADLSVANLVGTDFRGANLQGAKMIGAVLAMSALDLLRRAPSKTVFDDKTILPDGSRWTEGTDMTKFTGTPKDG